MKWFFNTIPYLLALATIAAGAVDLIQKWEELKGKPLRKAVPALFVLVGVLTVLSLYHDNDEKEKAAQKAQRDTEGLNTKLGIATQAQQTAIQAQKDNTEVFARQFQKLSDELGDLKTQAKTGALQRQLRSVQAELESTEKALEPGPKPKLLFTFAPFKDVPFPQHPEPVTDVTLPIDGDGSVQVQFAILNNTNVDARDVMVTLGICEQCRFAKEPFVALPNAVEVPAGFIQDSLPKNERAKYIGNLLSSSFDGPFVVDVRVPPLPGPPAFKMAAFQMGITYRCLGCGDSDPSKGTIHFLSPGQ